MGASLCDGASACVMLFLLALAVVARVAKCLQVCHGVTLAALLDGHNVVHDVAGLRAQLAKWLLCDVPIAQLAPVARLVERVIGTAPERVT